MDKLFYGNTIAEWLIGLSVIAASFVVGKLLYWFIAKVLKKMASKSRTKLDDIIIDMVEEPFVFSFVVAGIWVGTKMLKFSEGVDNFLGRGFYFIIIFVIAWALTRLIDALVKEYIRPAVDKSDSDLDDQLLPIITKAVKIVIWTLAIVVGLNNAGYDVGAVIAGLGIGGLAFALAAQDTVANLFGGIMIFVDRPFAVNERIKIDGFDGHIREIGLRSTRLQTLEGRFVTIPNRTFTDNSVENVTSEPSRRVSLSLGLTYDTDSNGIRKGMDILKEIVASHDSIEEDAYIAFTNFGDFSLGITFIYFIKPGCDIFGTQSDVNLQILEKYAAAKLEFAFPTQTLYNIQQAA